MNEEENKEILKEKTLLEEYNKLKESTVPKEQYDKDIQTLKEKNAIYLKAITEGNKVDVDSDDGISVQNAISDISKFKGTNLEYWKKMTATVDKALKELPESEITDMVGADGFDEIIKVNESMKKMVEDSKGDPDYFRTLYKNRVKDDAPRISAEIEKAGGLVNYLYSNQKK